MTEKCLRCDGTGRIPMEEGEAAKWLKSRGCGYMTANGSTVHCPECAGTGLVTRPDAATTDDTQEQP